MKNVKVTVIDNKTLELLEEAKIGDRIDLNTIHDIDIDSSEIDKLVAKVTDIEFTNRVEKEIKLLEQKKELEFKEILNQKQEELNKKIIKLEFEKNKLEENQKQVLEIENLKNSNLLKEKINEKALDLQKIEFKIQELEKELSLEKKDKLIQIESEKQKLIIEYTTEIQKKDSDLRQKENEIALLNDFKFKQSTKMIGETLEQHFKNVWEQTGKFMFPSARFEKDNQLSEDNTKGDFIYREFDENNIEILSIMFEMKNESDTTSSKHKNSDFYSKLDKDRKMKSCEYAVLASLLEKDVEYFNDIYTVNPKDYDKMYVIRPQHFITLINFLRQGNLTAQKYKLELNNIRKNEIDVTNFENNLKSFQEGFSKNYLSASKNFSIAIEEIDKSISHLQKIKESLTTTDNQLRLANQKSEDLTIKKLTTNALSVREMFDKVE